MCGPPIEQCEGYCEDLAERDFWDADTQALADESVKHLTHDENGNRYPDAT